MRCDDPEVRAAGLAYRSAAQGGAALVEAEEWKRKAESTCKETEAWNKACAAVKFEQARATLSRLSSRYEKASLRSPGFKEAVEWWLTADSFRNSARGTRGRLRKYADAQYAAAREACRRASPEHEVIAAEHAEARDQMNTRLREIEANQSAITRYTAEQLAIRDDV
ncbi:hypothetical protein ACSBPH_13775 [Microbacterium sp. F51-2R]|uniref:hypothetical protein n=1 Tax=Microbacterium sp. F51-2R TaxID=3445777 RepID=UPI003FA01393